MRYCAKNSKGKYFSHDIRDSDGTTYVTVPKPTFAWIGNLDNTQNLCDTLNRVYGEDFSVVEYPNKRRENNG